MSFKVVFLVLAGLLGIASAADRYEAEGAIVDENSVLKVVDANASGGYYVGMKEGTLTFKVTVSSTGFYTIWSYYMVDDPNGKIQNLVVNGVSCGQMSYPYTEKFVLVKSSAKVKLAAGENTVSITKSWGWVNLDYIEITSFENTPFNYSTSLVTPNPSESAKKIYGFLCENFQKKIISGVMTNTVMLNDGKYTPNTVEDQVETKWIKDSSGKYTALVGVDFIHATGKNSESEWHHGYTKATLSLARDVFRRGGIPAYCWHWKDPLNDVEAFYSPSATGNTPTTFNLMNAFTDSTTCESFNTESAEYKGIVDDMDTIAMYLKTLQDSGVAVLWRPLHEASGKWFWWGYKGAKPCKALYRLLFDRFVNYHKLNNLIWVWTTDEAGDALDWYPGDEYVDIVGRDYYYYPREANHGSLVASYEKVKDIYSGKKIIALSENGSVPHPDSLAGDGAGWSYFMPWYGDYTMDGWAHDNTAADWKAIMNHDYVITLDEMPGWSNYVVDVTVPQVKIKAEAPNALRINQGVLELNLSGNSATAVDLYNLRGIHIATLNADVLTKGIHRFCLDGIAKGSYVVRVTCNASTMFTQQIIVR